MARPRRDRLPPQRQKVFDFIATEIAAGRPGPSYAMIARHMGWKSTGSARDACSKLVHYDGWLEWTDRHRKAFRIREDA